MEYSGVQWSTVEYSGVQWCTVVYSGVQWSTVEYSGVQWSTVEYSVSDQLRKLYLKRLEFECHGIGFWNRYLPHTLLTGAVVIRVVGTRQMALVLDYFTTTYC